MLRARGFPLHDPPAPVQFEDADPRVVEQGGRGRAPRLGAEQRLPDADELLDMGQQPLDHRSRRQSADRLGVRA